MASPSNATKSQKAGAQPPKSSAMATPKPVLRSNISDEKDDALKPIKPTNKGRKFWKIIAIIVTILSGLGLATFGGIYYNGTKLKSDFENKILLAIDRHTAMHLRDGGSVTEMALVDSIRHCIPDVAFSPQFIARNGLRDAPGDAIISAVERYCLKQILIEVAWNEIISLEVVRHRAETEATLNNVSQYDDYLHFILTFAKIKGYSIPEDVKDFKMDPTILNRFGNGVDPKDR